MRRGESNTARAPRASVSVATDFSAHATPCASRGAQNSAGGEEARGIKQALETGAPSLLGCRTGAQVAQAVAAGHAHRLPACAGRGDGGDRKGLRRRHKHGGRRQQPPQHRRGSARQRTAEGAHSEEGRRL